MIKSLKKSFEMKNRQLPYFYDETWLTNGKFAVARRKVKDDFRYCLSREGVAQPDIKRVIPERNDEFKTVCKTNRLYSLDETLACVFVDDEGKEYLVDRDYVEHFGLNVLYTAGEKQPLITGEEDFVIMPMKNPE